MDLDGGGVVVVGGGIAGLTAAYRLAHDGAGVVVLEAADRTGGNVRSVDVGGMRLEAGPDSMLARKPWAVDLCRELGLGDDLVAPRTAGALVVAGSGLLPLPSGPFGISTDVFEMATWPGLSIAGRLRAAADLARPRRRSTGDESLGSLLRRRLGDEVVEVLLAPLLGGLWAGDVDRLSAVATFPELVGWEQRHGSLLRGARAAAAASRDRPRSPVFMSVRGGLERLTAALAERLGDRLRTGVRAISLERFGRGHVVRTSAGEVPAGAVVLATPAPVSAALVTGASPRATAALRRIPHASTAVVLLVYGPGTAALLPDASGFVAPRGTLATTACTFVSRKWPEDAFGDRAVVRAFVGGIGDEGALDDTDDGIVRRVCEQLASRFELPAAPEGAAVVRWPDAMPQYAVGHRALLLEIDRSLPAGVFVTGQAYRGTGLPDCVRDAGRVAGRVREHLGCR